MGCHLNAGRAGGIGDQLVAIPPPPRAVVKPQEAVGGRGRYGELTECPGQRFHFRMCQGSLSDRSYQMTAFPADDSTPLPPVLTSPGSHLISPFRIPKWPSLRFPWMLRYRVQMLATSKRRLVEGKGGSDYSVTARLLGGLVSMTRNRPTDYNSIPKLGYCGSQIVITGNCDPGPHVGSQGLL